jgi:two-component system, NarL family, sensor histidine kinase UhpB
VWGAGLLAGRAVQLAGLLISVLIFWAVVIWINPNTPEIADLKVARLQLAGLASPDIGALLEADLAPVTQPIRSPYRFAVIRVEARVADPQTADVAVFFRRARDNCATYVNGHLAAPTPGIVGEESTFHGVHARFVKLLPALLVAGANHVDFLCARGPFGTAGVSMREIYFGPSARLEPAYAHSRFLQVDLPELTAISAGLVLMFSLALSSLIQKPALTLAIALTLGFFFARELVSLWVNVAWPQVLRDAYGILVAIGLWLSAAAFVNEWTGANRKLRVAMPVAGVVASVAVLISFSAYSGIEAYLTAGWAELAVILVALPFMTQRLVRFYSSAPAGAVGEVIAFGTALILAYFSFVSEVAVDLQYTVTVPVHSDAYSRATTIALISAIAIGLARLGVGLYQLATLNNETLAQKVDEKERELEANHALLRAREREHALLAERGRIMRDVHDGIGSQLLGLLIQARGGKTQREELAAGIQTALDDLYLVVDSLDQADGPLESALGTFRARVEPKCVAAGIAVDWQVESIGATPTIGPTSVLHIYRILQEALSNAIRHGKPDILVFGLRRDAPDQIEISLRDNGVGFDSNAMARSGRGLSNMRKRASAIGGHIEVTGGAGGSCVRLVLPV